MGPIVATCGNHGRPTSGVRPSILSPKGQRSVDLAAASRHELRPPRFRVRQCRISSRPDKEKSNASVSYLLSGECVLIRRQVRACDAYHGPLRGCRLAPLLCKRCLSRVAEELVLCRRTRQQTILSGFGLIRLLAQLLLSGERGGWNASTIPSIPSYASGVIAGRFTLTDTPIDFWTIQGMKPPDPDSEAEKRWVKEDCPSAYT